MPSWVYDVIIILFGLGDIVFFFVLPTMEARETASARKRRELLEHRREQIKVDLEEWEALQKMKPQHKE